MVNAATDLFNANVTIVVSQDEELTCFKSFSYP